MCKILKGATIIDCVNSNPIRDCDLVIKDNIILDLGMEKEKEFQAETIIDLSEKIVIPGLINMHAHLTADDTINFMDYMLKSTDEELLLQAAKSSVLALNSGVTTVRDCGSKNNLVHWLRDSINSGKLIGPRIISCGMPITITGGHCYYLGIETDGVYEIRKTVRNLIKQGADFIKVMVTGGGSTPQTDKKTTYFSNGELFALVDESHRFNKKVAAHVHGTEGVLQSAIAGVDTIEHSSFLTDKGMKVENNIIECIKKNSISIVPTISGTICLDYEGPFYLNSFNLSNIDRRAFFNARFQLFKDFLKSGVNILAGNDAGVTGTPHDGFIYELEMMAELGMKKEDVIKAATIKASTALGLKDEIGTIEKGKIADLLVLNGNPLEDIHTLRNPYMVITKGIIINGKKCVL